MQGEEYTGSQYSINKLQGEGQNLLSSELKLNCWPLLVINKAGKCPCFNTNTN